jgi:hypothetical protein
VGRRGVVGAAVALLVVASLILSAFFCIPWSIAHDRAPEALQPRKRIDNANAYYVKAWKTGNAEMFANNFAKKGPYSTPVAKLLPATTPSAST